MHVGFYLKTIPHQRQEQLAGICVHVKYHTLKRRQASLSSGGLSVMTCDLAGIFIILSSLIRCTSMTLNIHYALSTSHYHQVHFFFFNKVPRLSGGDSTREHGPDMSTDSAYEHVFHV